MRSVCTLLAGKGAVLLLSLTVISFVVPSLHHRLLDAHFMLGCVALQVRKVSDKAPAVTVQERISIFTRPCCVCDAPCCLRMWDDLCFLCLICFLDVLL